MTLFRRRALPLMLISGAISLVLQAAYVGISKSDPEEYQVIKRRLSDGKVTSLMKYGEAQHASLGSLSRPGWVFLTYTGNPDQVSKHPDWAPYTREVIALRLDGSGDVRRIVQTGNVPLDYWSETHASPSPDGSQMVWSSNWGVPGGPVYDFRRSPRLASGGPFEAN